MELLWTAIAVVGVGVELYALYDCLADRRALASANLNGPMFLVSNMGVRSAAVALGVQVAFATLGILAMTMPNPAPTNWFNQVASFLLVLAAAMIVVASLLNQLDRRRLRRRFGYPDRHRH